MVALDGIMSVWQKTDGLDFNETKILNTYGICVIILLIDTEIWFDMNRLRRKEKQLCTQVIKKEAT